MLKLLESKLLVSHAAGIADIYLFTLLLMKYTVDVHRHIHTVIMYLQMRL